MKDVYYDLIDRYNNIENAAGTAEADKRILSEISDSEVYAALNPDRTDCAECYPWQNSDKVLCMGANFGAYVSLAGRVHTLDIADVADERLELIRKRYHLSGAAKTDVHSIGAGGNAKDGEASSAASVSKEDAAKTDSAAGFGNLRLIKEVTDSDYDVVIADITSADNEWELKGDKLSFLKSACSHLKTGGTLIFIADNADALKFKAGILPKHPELLIDKSFAESIASACGFARVKRYYPLQNAAFARNIYSDTFMPDGGSFKNIADGSFEERTAVFNEEGLYGSLCEKGHFADYAPSYIYVYTGYHLGDTKFDIASATEIGKVPNSSQTHGEEQAHTDEQAADVNTEPTGLCGGPECAVNFPDYIRFNRTRADKYAIKTELYISGASNERFVRKQALSQEANEHIESFAHKYELIQGGFNVSQGEITHSTSDTADTSENAFILGNIEAARPRLGKTADGLSYADFDYIEGKELSALLAEHITDGRAPEQEITKAL